MSLDKCITITSVTGNRCVTSTSNASCTSGSQIPIDICHPDIQPTPPTKCVNDNVRRPWPSPPPAEIGCNPISMQITNSDQNIRLEGNVSYIAGDACLPQMNLNLVVPADLGAGGGSPSISGFGYTQYANCVRVGNTSRDRYKTPQSFYGNEAGAASFYPKTTGEMGADDCEPRCVSRSRYGAQVAKFNLIGPILGEIQSFSPVMSHTIEGEHVVTAWKYKWVASICVTAADRCLPSNCTTASWMDYNGSLEYQDAWNNKENVIDGHMTPGVDLKDMLSKGYKPQPIAAGTQVFVYGWVPWGTEEVYDQTTGTRSAQPTDSCNCDIVWFFSEQNAFGGECKDNSTSNVNPSMLPSRKINSAGMFFGSTDNANRV